MRLLRSVLLFFFTFVCKWHWSQILLFCFDIYLGFNGVDQFWEIPSFLTSNHLPPSRQCRRLQLWLVPVILDQDWSQTRVWKISCGGNLAVVVLSGEAGFNASPSSIGWGCNLCPPFPPLWLKKAAFDGSSSGPAPVIQVPRVFPIADAYCSRPPLNSAPSQELNLPLLSQRGGSIALLWGAHSRAFFLLFFQSGPCVPKPWNSPLCGMTTMCNFIRHLKTDCLCV